jgi:hypothetical protein
MSDEVEKEMSLGTRQGAEGLWQEWRGGRKNPSEELNLKPSGYRFISWRVTL